MVIIDIDRFYHQDLEIFGQKFWQQRYKTPSIISIPIAPRKNKEVQRLTKLNLNLAITRQPTLTKPKTYYHNIQRSFKPNPTMLEAEVNSEESKQTVEN